MLLVSAATLDSAIICTTNLSSRPWVPHLSYHCRTDMRTITCILLSVLAPAALADVYMHAPRGSNDRNCEDNANRNNASEQSCWHL